LKKKKIYVVDDSIYFYYVGQDDSVYAEHRPMPLTLIDRPPSSPSRFDLKTRLHRSQSQYQIRPSTKSTPDRVASPLSLYEIIHRPPSQTPLPMHRSHIDQSIVKFKSSSFQEDKTVLQLSNQPKPFRPQTVPTVPTTYEVKRGGKIYKVIVGYVSPFTSPLQRKELHLKTDGEVQSVVKKIQEQQEKQRASKPQVWLGLPTQ
jgi:hypothetical protein